METGWSERQTCSLSPGSLLWPPRAVCPRSGRLIWAPWGMGVPPNRRAPPSLALLSPSQAPQPRAELGVVPAPPPAPGVLPLPVLRGPRSRCRTPTFPQAPQASCCPRSHVPLPTGPHPVPQQGPRHQPTRARHRGVTHLNLGCREIAGAVGPQGDIHPEANLGPAFPTWSASCQALGPPGPCRPHPVPRAPWCPVGGGPVEGERLPRAGQPGWGEAGRRSLQGGLLQELLPHNPPRPSL